MRVILRSREVMQLRYLHLYRLSIRAPRSLSCLLDPTTTRAAARLQRSELRSPLRGSLEGYPCPSREERV